MITVFSFSKGVFKVQNDPKTVEPPKRNEKKWIILKKPTKEDFEKIKKFNIHSLTIEDLKSKNTKIKYEEFENYTYFSQHGVNAKNFKDFPLYNIDGNRFLITVHFNNNNIVDGLIEKERIVKELMSKGVDNVLYKILDRLIDNYVIIKEKLFDELTNLEREVFESRNQQALMNLFEHERKVLRIKQLTGANEDICLKLCSATNNDIKKELIPYFKDIYDHISKVDDNLEYVISQINSLRDNYMAITSNKINNVMKVLTLFTAFLLPLSLITGYYGMNIALPFQQSPYANSIILGIFAAILLVMWIFFSKNDLF